MGCMNTTPVLPNIRINEHGFAVEDTASTERQVATVSFSKRKSMTARGLAANAHQINAGLLNIYYNAEKNNRNRYTRKKPMRSRQSGRLTPSSMDFDNISLASVQSVSGSVASLDIAAITDSHRHWSFPRWGHYKKCTFCGCEDHPSPPGHRHESGAHGSMIRKQNNQKMPTKDRDTGGRCAMAFANLLAVNALDLTAPASDALLKNRKNAWVQLAGHPGSFAPAGPHTIWKKRMQKENNETKAYQALMQDIVADVVPKFYREVEYNGDFFIEIEDLLQHFHDPAIMDIKIGTRTFMESEVKNPVLRKDLYEKMMKLNPEEPTQEEHEEKAITKLRYMQFREKGSTTASLGFRIEAIRMAGEKPINEIKKIRTRDQVLSYISKFIHYNSVVRDKFVSRLEHIAALFESSLFFNNHELVGSSLLLMHDSENKAGIWMIDFAKALQVETTLTHRAPWVVGNHEDGYLTGIHNLIQVMKDVSTEKPESRAPSISDVNINLHQPNAPTSKITAQTDKPAIALVTSGKREDTTTGSNSTNASPSATLKIQNDAKVQNVQPADADESEQKGEVDKDDDEKVDNVKVENDAQEKVDDSESNGANSQESSSLTGSHTEDSRNTDAGNKTTEDKEDSEKDDFTVLASENRDGNDDILSENEDKDNEEPAKKLSKS